MVLEQKRRNVCVVSNLFKLKDGEGVEELVCRDEVGETVVGQGPDFLAPSDWDAVVGDGCPERLFRIVFEGSGSAELCVLCLAERRACFNEVDFGNGGEERAERLSSLF